MIFDIAKGMVCKMPLIKLVLMDSDLCPYLAEFLVIVLYKVGDKGAFGSECYLAH